MSLEVKGLSRTETKLFSVQGVFRFGPYVVCMEAVCEEDCTKGSSSLWRQSQIKEAFEEWCVGRRLDDAPWSLAKGR